MKVLFTSTMLLCLCASAWAGSIEKLEFTELPSAKTVSLTQWHGKKLLVLFWRSDCAPCLKEMNVLPDIATANKKLPIALVSLHDEKHTREHLPTLPENVHTLLASADGKAVLVAFGNDRTLALPYSVMLDKNGAVCAKHYGILSPDTVKEWQKTCK